MRLKREERYQLKLIRLAKEVYRRTGNWATYEHQPAFTGSPHQFSVFNTRDKKRIVQYQYGIDTAEACYEWAVAECRKEGLIR
jgi:hypothetical protein